MIDNMNHIGHNVVIGKNACIAAQTGISGSTNRNNVTWWASWFCWSYFNRQNVIIAAKSGVTKNIKDNSVVAGFQQLI